MHFRAGLGEWRRSLRGPSSARAMAEELFALRGPRIDDVEGSLIELPILTILRKKGKVSRSRYLRRQRSERYLKGMILLSLAANFPNMSTVEPHEFCRRSYSRRAAPESMIIAFFCKFRDHIKEFTYMYLIHRNRTYRTQLIADGNTKNSMKTQLRQRFSIFYHVVFRPHDFYCSA